MKKEERLKGNLKENLKRVFPKDKERQKLAYDLLEKLRADKDNMLPSTDANTEKKREVLQTLVADEFLTRDRPGEPCFYRARLGWCDLYGVMLPYKNSATET